jgi:endonuclease/exonuclease/phosphatase family metal-dependent hydrolase
MRLAEAHWIQRLVADWAAAGVPVLVAGDLNTLSPLDAVPCHYTCAAGGAGACSPAADGQPPPPLEPHLATYLLDPHTPAYLRRKFLASWGADQEEALAAGDVDSGAALPDYRPMCALLGTTLDAALVTTWCTDAAYAGSTAANAATPPPPPPPPRTALYDAVAASRTAASLPPCEGSIPTELATDNEALEAHDAPAMPPLRIDHVLVSAHALWGTAPGAGGDGGGADHAGAYERLAARVNCRILDARRTRRATALLSDHFPVLCDVPLE